MSLRFSIYFLFISFFVASHSIALERQVAMATKAEWKNDSVKHQMLLLAGEQHLLASHLPQWEPPLNFQAFVEVKFDDSETQSKLEQNLRKSSNFYTLVPNQLDKNDLKSGQPFRVKVDIFDKVNEEVNKKLIASAEASMRALFYRQIQAYENKNQYSKYEKYYSVRSGSKSYLFNRISVYRPFDHIVIAENQCQDYPNTMEVRMLKSKPQPTFSGSIDSLKEIAKRYDLTNLTTIYLDKTSLKSK